MRTLFGCLLVLGAGCFAAGVSAEDAAAPTAQPQEAPSWAPGAMATPQTASVPGRVVAATAGVTLVLPESWRAADVSTRELDEDQAQAIHVGAKGALLIELTEQGGKPRTLLTVYRVSVDAWRLLEKDGKAGPGRVTMNNFDSAFVVIRPEETRKRDRYALLRGDVEDVIATLGIYDARREGTVQRVAIGPKWAGKLPDGAPITLQLDPNGTLAITWGKDGKSGRGQWLQRESQVIAHVVGIDPMPRKAILMHFDGKGLVVVSWDDNVFGAAGARLEAQP